MPLGRRHVTLRRVETGDGLRGKCDGPDEMPRAWDGGKVEPGEIREAQASVLDGSLWTGVRMGRG